MLVVFVVCDPITISLFSTLTVKCGGLYADESILAMAEKLPEQVTENSRAPVYGLERLPMNWVLSVPGVQQ